MRSPVQFDVYIAKFLALYCALRTRDEQTQTEKKKKTKQNWGKRTHSCLEMHTA